MTLLWKKESRHESSLYVNIFHKFNSDDRFGLGENHKKSHVKKKKLIKMYVHLGKSNAQSLVYRKQGDMLFQQGKWQEAIQLYNQSLCLGTVASQQMGIVYAKRAQCFFKMRMYVKCLNDLDLARFSNYPRQQYALLEMREAQCLKLMHESADVASTLPELISKPSAKWPEMVDALKMERSANGNRYIVATKDINVGEIVMVEKSFISTYTKSYQKCCICSVTLTNLIPCNQCSKVLLCPDCNGSIIHKVECDVRPVFSNRDYPPVSDIFRSILLAMTMFENVDKLMEFIEPIVSNADTTNADATHSTNDQKSKYRVILHLTRNSFNLEKDIASAFVNYSSLICHDTVRLYFRTERHRRFLMHLVCHHLTVLKGRGVSSTVVGFGNGIERTDFSFLLAINLKHSCAPHVTLRMIDGYAVMLTIRPIKEGQSVLLSQNESIMMDDVDERRKAMKIGSKRECNCERCTFEMNDNRLIPNPQMIADPDFQYIVHRLNEDDDIDAQPDDFLKCAESFLNKYGDQKWDDALGLVYLCNYCGIKAKLNNCQRFNDE